MGKTISERGIALLKQFEGLELTAYRDSVGVLTIGYGSTGPHVQEGMRITEAEAEVLLKKDLERFEQGVNRLVGPLVNQNQFDALVVFCYNLGMGAFLRSTLLKKINANPNDPTIRDEFGKWVKAGGVALRGLVRRREAEANLYFLKP